LKNFSLTDEEFEACRAFGRNESPGTNAIRSKRTEGSVGEDKFIQDSIGGKASEFIAYKTLLDKGYKPDNTPDLNIYSVGDKNYDPDLYVTLANGKTWRIHVKSCREFYKEHSWLFTKGDKLISDPRPNDLICFVLINAGFKSGRVHRICPASWIFPDLIGEPRNDKMASTKVAIYKHSIEKKERNKLASI